MRLTTLLEGLAVQVVLSLAACTGDTLPGGLAALPEPSDLAMPATPDSTPPTDPGCGVLDVHFTVAAAGLQVVLWLEDTQGAVVDTLYITQATGQRGLGNRPGAARFKTDFKWPYGRREMVFPVWAHRRGHRYPRLVMGGVCGASMTDSCPGGAGACGMDCDDDDIAYHARVSSPEPYFCPPTGGVTRPGMPDVITCASPYYGSKGAVSGTSLYPPRADLTSCNEHDSPAACAMMQKPNDLVAVSQATPLPSVEVETSAQIGGGERDLVLWLETSQESDFNAAHHHPQQLDDVPSIQSYGHDFLGQPSMVYRAVVHAGGAVSQAYPTWVGYGSWDGSDGKLNAPDATVTVGTAGTGAGRLRSLTAISGRCP